MKWYKKLERKGIWELWQPNTWSSGDTNSILQERFEKDRILNKSKISRVTKLEWRCIEKLNPYIMIIKYYFPNVEF